MHDKFAQRLPSVIGNRVWRLNLFRLVWFWKLVLGSGCRHFVFDFINFVPVGISCFPFGPREKSIPDIWQPNICVCTLFASDSICHSHMCTIFAHFIYGDIVYRTRTLTCGSSITFKPNESSPNGQLKMAACSSWRWQCCWCDCVHVGIFAHFDKNC